MPPLQTFQLRHQAQPDGFAFQVLHRGKQLGVFEVPGFVGRAVPGAGNSDLRRELQWYLEEFLDYPFSPNVERADRALAALRAWGEDVYRALFDNRSVGAKLERAAEDGLHRLRLEIVSDDPGVLGWPWEALRDPSAGAAAIDLQVVRRVEKDVRDPVKLSRKLPKDRVNVLLVTARPYGPGDVPYRSVSRKLVELVRRQGLPANVTVLRPPTMARLREVLHEQPDTFHVLHFDGHGGYGSPQASSHRYAGPVGQLVFEDDHGGPDPIDAGRLGALLREHRIPAVVMNACQSGMVDERADSPFASVAAGLLHAGVRSVLAMAYSLYVSAAEELLPAFYEALFREGDLAAATRAGRQRLLERPGRVCARGRYPLQDWLVPVLYDQQPLDFKFARTAREAADKARSEAGLAWSPGGAAPGLPPQPLDARSPHGLIGRDDALLAIERALLRPVPGVLLRGLGGVGKTTLAWHALVWLSETGGLPERVLWVDLRDIRNADQLLHTLGVPLYSEVFRTYNLQDKIAALQHAARQVPMLWVWDNLEVAAGTPDSLVPAQLSPEDRAVVRDLLAGLRDSRAHVLITSRGDEPWLGGPEALLPVPLGGLSGEERWALCETILGELQVRVDRDDPELGRLLDWLQGHPLMMRAVLPRLKDQRPAAVRAALERDLSAVLGSGAEAERRLWATLRFAEEGLPAEFKPLLYPLSLHERYVGLGLLEAMAKQVGPGWSRARLEAVLGALVHAGLAQRLRVDLWQLHPALGTWLRARELLPPAEAAPWQRAFVDVMGTVADQLAPRPLHEQRGPFTLFEGSFRRALGLAEGQGMEAHVAALVQALAAWAQNRRDLEGAERLYERLAEHQRERGDEKVEAAACHQLGIVAEARRDLEAAERWYRRALDLSEKLGDEHGAAITYHQLGIVAQARRDLEAAERWYRRSLDIEEKLGDEHGAASTYHQLGSVAEARRDLDAAERWYRRSLDIKEKLGDEHGAASTYHQLGNVAQARRDLEAAERWYRRALDIEEKLGIEHYAASTYHQLGNVAKARRDLEAAERWYRRSLDIKEKLGDEHGAASTYHQLGSVAQARRDLEAAERWYRRSLDIEEKLGDEHGAASTYHQLGSVAKARRDLEAAERWYRRSLDIKEKLGDEHGAAYTLGQLGNLADLRQQPLEAARWYLRALAGFLATRDPHNAQAVADNYRLLFQEAPPELQPQLHALWAEAGHPPRSDA